MKKRKYIIAAPITETWYFSVIATSKKEAMKKYLNNDKDVHQEYSIGGWPEGSETKIVKILNMDEEVK